ncbi:hypothetical protein COLO4_00155 [Corchorus olitorius]|uniref:RNase H type-1 domain-containing protein n=1 Tax=Corchorus olitorius TaxID=93759 RepID=A0A1R3L4J0_9ROSI|nr:hypothetical protein COLO4_00155 [Corchorus olitorius]
MLVRTSSAEMAEALAIWLANDLAKGWNQIIIESDCRKVVRWLQQSTSTSSWKSWAIIEDIRLKLNLVQYVSFQYVNRAANLLADWVARKTRTRTCPND